MSNNAANLMRNTFERANLLASTQEQSVPLYLLGPDHLGEWLSGTGQAWAEWLKAQDFRAKTGQVCVLPALDQSGIGGAILGLGSEADQKHKRFGAVAGRRHLPAVDFHLATPMSLAEGRAFIMAWGFDAYRFTTYRQSRKAEQSAAARLFCPELVNDPLTLALLEAEFMARDLINTPTNDMGPVQLEAAFHTLAARFKARSHSIIGTDLQQQGFSMIHAVGRAAEQAPRLLDLHWHGSTAPGDAPLLTLVGKGVCFDTGGLNIKPSSSMGLMKKDMGGAANVMALAHVIMQLDLPIALRVLVPAVENSISGGAMRPGDILTSRKGLTVEINNTDAEGRLILADALAYADESLNSRQNPQDVAISIATLTGAARVALGPDLAPYFTDSGPLSAAIEGGAAIGLDPVWRLPFWKGYESLIEPALADLDNAPSGGFAGAIVAALFVRRFIEHPRYVHFDIYAHSPQNAPGRPKGGVTQGIRAILYALPDIFDFSGDEFMG